MPEASARSLTFEARHPTQADQSRATIKNRPSSAGRTSDTTVTLIGSVPANGAIRNRRTPRPAISYTALVSPNSRGTFPLPERERKGLVFSATQTDNHLVR